MPSLRPSGNQAGFGILHLLVSLGVLVATLYFVMKQRMPSRDSSTPTIKEEAVINDVQIQLDEAAKLQEKKMGCAIEKENCEK